MNSPKKVSAPIRMTAELLAKVAEASRKTGLSQADILRLALNLGLENLRRINYDLPKVILDATSKDQIRLHPLKAAEDPMGNDPCHSTLAHSVKYPKGKPRKSG